MPVFLQRIIAFFRRYPGILYSLVLLVLIPLVLFYNTMFVTRSFTSAIDRTLQSKALMVENVLEVFLADSVDDPSAVQKKVREVARTNEDIHNLRVLREQGGGQFRVLASQDASEVDQTTSDPSLALALSQNQTIANIRVRENGERFWHVIKPLHDNNGTKVGVVTMALSLARTDSVITQTITRSYLLVVAAIVLSVLLVAQHTRLFGYVSLSKRLREIDQMKDNFIRMATHELQSPIVNIRGYLRTLEEEVKEKLDERELQLLDRAAISAKNMSNLSEDILEVSRIEQGRLDLTPETIDPREVIRDVEEEMAIKAEEKDLTFTASVPDQQALIRVNPKRLRQILTNFVSNAIKYTPEGTVEIVAEIDEKKRNYRIAVRDTGIGLSAEERKSLFQRFHRIKTRETAGIPGTGLGLWISKQLAEKMDGQVHVESMKGVGSKFSVVFPLVQHEEN